MPRPPRPPQERFWDKVTKGDGCWEWTGSRLPRGYGTFRVGTRPADPHSYTHRLAWEWANGPIPAGMHVLHHCDNPPCVRPDHLFIGTVKDNVADMMAKGRGWARPPRVECPRGHLYAETRDARGGCRICKRDQMRQYRAARKAG